MLLGYNILDRHKSSLAKFQYSIYSLARFMTYRFPEMVHNRKIRLVLCLQGIFCSTLFFLEEVYMGLMKKSDWQPWIWPLFTSHWVEYSESSFINVGNDLRIYLTLEVIICSGERQFSELEVVE